MNINDMIFQGNLYKFYDNNINPTLLEIMYRLRNIDNKYFFAEEISTGAIFPTFCYSSELKYSFRIRSLSYLSYGTYFVYSNITGDKNALGSYHIDLEGQKISQAIPTAEEINEYLNHAEQTKSFKTMIRNNERENRFICDRNIIKEKIKHIKSLEENDEHYETKINLKSIQSIGYDLSTKEKLCRLVGRDNEIKKVIKSVGIKNNSVILIGEAGCGKTAIAEAIALEIKKGKNKWLKNKTLILINTNAIVSGTRNRGDFEEKMENLISFCQKNKGKVILFIDEIHTLCGLGTAEGLKQDAMDILKPFLSSRDVVIIGATTKKEYGLLAKDEAFCRRFTEIDINLLPKETIIEILHNFIDELKDEYNVNFPFNQEETSIILETLVNITDKSHQMLIGKPQVTNPTLSKSILEDAFVEAVYNEKKEISIYDITSAIIESDKLSPTIRKEIAYRLQKELEKEKLEIANPQKVLVLQFNKK